MNEDIPLWRIVRNDYGALVLLLVSPMGTVFAFGKWKALSADERSWAAGIAGGLAFVCLFLLWRRVRGIRETLNTGMRVPGRIVSVFFHEDRGRVEFEYQYAGPRTAGVAITKNAGTSLLAAGLPIDLVVHPERPDEPLVLGLYSRDGFRGLEEVLHARVAEEFAKADKTELSDPKVRPITPEVAARLGFEPEFMAFLFAKSRPACFSYWVESPEKGWTSQVPSHVDAAFALWSTNADQTLVCEGQGRRWFIHGFHDDPETEDIASTVQGLLAELFFTMAESDATVVELREGAKSCGFRHVEQVIAVIEGPEDDYFEEKDRVLKDIDEGVPVKGNG